MAKIPGDAVQCKGSALDPQDHPKIYFFNKKKLKPTS